MPCYIFFSVRHCFQIVVREPNCSAKNMASYAWFKILSYKFYVWNTWTRQLCFENVRVPGPQSLPYYNIYGEAKIDYHVCISLFARLFVSVCLSKQGRFNQESSWSGVCSAMKTEQSWFDGLTSDWMLSGATRQRHARSACLWHQQLDTGDWNWLPASRERISFC